MKGVASGSVKYVRVIEAKSKRGLSGGSWRGLGAQVPTVNWTDFTAKRILGDAPVESDGSASFRVPSDRFVYFQLLDKDRKMIQSMRTGTSIHSGERQGCVGCHESRANAATTSVAANLTKAFQREPSNLEPWYGETRAFSYMAEVQPVLDKHCVKCHDFKDKADSKIVLAGDKGFAFNASYAELQSTGFTGSIGAGPAGHMPAKTWGSHTSPLIKLLNAGHYDVKLDEESMARLCTWIDLNSPYYPTTYASRSGPGPGRNPLTKTQTVRLFQLTGLNDKKVGTAEFFAGPQVSFDRPEQSPCLKSLDDDEKAHQEAVAIIRAGKESLEKLPRADMPGREFVVNDRDRRRQAHQEKYLEIERKVRAAIRDGGKIKDSPDAEKDTLGL